MRSLAEITSVDEAADAGADTKPLPPLENYPDTCDVCRGVGFVLDEAEWENSRYRGGLVPCPACSPQRQQERLERISGLSEDMRSWTFARFAREWGRQEALEAAQAALDDMRGFLTLYGPWGTGKTFLLACIVNETRKRGQTAIYTTVADLLDDLRETFDPESSESYSQLWHRVMNAKVLALDEVEKFRASEWAEEKFFQLVDNRYRLASECLTAFATNVTVKAGARVIKNTRYPGYLESRLLDGRFRVVEVGGGDVRPFARWGKGS